MKFISDTINRCFLRDVYDGNCTCLIIKQKIKLLSNRYLFMLNKGVQNNSKRVVKNRYLYVNKMLIKKKNRNSDRWFTSVSSFLNENRLNFFLIQ